MRIPISNLYVVTRGLYGFRMLWHSGALLVGFWVGTSTPPPWISNGPKIYASAPGGVDCAKLSDDKRELTEEDPEGFWQDGAGTSISFNRETWVLTVCHAGESVAARLDGEPGGDFRVNVKTPFFKDVNGDGKPEFIVWYGQCVDGPCVGEHMVLQVDGKKLRRLASTQADRLDVIQEDGREAFLLTRYCFTPEFRIAYEYFAFAALGPRGLVIVPNRHVQEQYPRTMTRVMDGIRASAARASTDSQRKIQLLILDAYNGRAGKELKGQSPRLGADQETSCDAWGIINSVIR